ncbi:response regulator transcription factor [uncultured Campylobacter sp.]|uniref:response regulator transcription factor n=1 Tax=uncultured Campylobacter sp. TaxID=218934 RepID=UPI0026264FEB|nr:response regulator transcription factor [uncultured Campylobacter sp.]
MKILLIEDDRDLNELLSIKFKNLGYELFSFFDLKNVKSCLDENDIDIMIVDRNITNKDSLDFIKSLREEAYNEPIIFLTAKTLQKDILEGFSVGCDDYITKPFNFDELLFRIKAVVKRHKKENSKVSFMNFLLDNESRQCFEDGKEIQISNLEFELLKCFFENKNTVLTRQFLSEMVWKSDSANDKTINIALTRLRNKIPKLKNHITSIRGMGYKIC